MDPALAAMLTETLLIAPYAGQDGYGKPSYGPAVSTPARLERHFQTMATVTGPQLVEQTRAFIEGTALVDERAQITFPDASQPPLQGLKLVRDEYGQADHYVLYF